MTSYLDFLIEDDADALAELGYAEMRSRIPGWDPIVGEVDTVLIQAFARIAAQVRASAGIVPIGAFRWLATQFGLAPQPGVAATGLANIHSIDALGHVIPADTQFTALNPAGEPRTFSTTIDATIIAPFNSVTGVPIVAAQPGALDNGLVTLVGPPAAPVLLPVDSLGYIDIAVITPDPTAGGIDAETDDEFLASLVRRFALQSAAPILPNDFAAILLDVLPPESRTVAVDGWDPGLGTSANDRTVTVFALDPTGAALSAPTKAAGVAYLNSLREVNWLNYVEDPIFFDVSVKFTAHAVPGFDPAAVQAAALAAVTSYLSPANWGIPIFETLTGWTLSEGGDKVRLGELYQVLNAVDGLAYVDTLFLKAGLVAPTTEVADVALTGGPVVVPQPGSITGTVT